MKKHPSIFFFSVLVLAWLFDFLFWNRSAGISFALYILLLLGAGVFLLWREGFQPHRNTLLLFLPLLFFAIFSALRREPLTAFLTHTLSLALLAGVALTYRGGRWLEYSLADYLQKFGGLLLSLLARPALSWAEWRQQAPAKPQANPALWAALRGLFLSLPVLAFFAALLSSADLVFAERLESFTSLFRLENLPEYIFRAVYISFLAYMLAGAYLHAALRSSEENLLGQEKPLVPRFLGFIEAVFVLGSVSLLFASFVLVQFQYFFGGQANIQLQGYTYAEYARRGFGELVTVAFFALLLFLALSATAKRQTPSQARAFASLGLALFGLVAVMLVSAYLRLNLYETAYGFTRLRAYTHVFIIALAFLLAAIVLLEFLNRQRAFALALFLFVIGFSASLPLLNVDAFIVRQNIHRFWAGEDLDVGYLASLSADATPILVEMYQAAEYPPTRLRLGAALACIQFRAAEPAPAGDWRSLHLADFSAAQALPPLAEDLKIYQIDDSSYPVTVIAPHGETFECDSLVFD